MAKRGRAKKAAQGVRPEVNVPEKTTAESWQYDSRYDPGINVNGKRQTLKEIPYELIDELAKTHEKVVVNVQRRNNKGQLASLGYSGMLWDTPDLARVADWVLPRAGGGIYVVTVTDPKNASHRLIPSFEVPIDAPVRAPIPYHMNVVGAPVFGVPSTFTREVPFVPTPGVPLPPGPIMPPPVQPMSEEQANAPAQPGIMPPPRNPMSKWSQGLDPLSYQQMQESAAMQAAQVGRQVAFGYGIPAAPAATFASDQLAVDALRRAESEKAELRAKFDALMERTSEREREHEKVLREQTERHREELHNIRIEMLRSELTSKSSQPQGLKLPELIAALAPFAPVFAAFVTSSKESASKSLEVQQQGINQLMQLMVAQANKPAPDPLSAVEKFLPLFAQMNKGNEGSAALFEAMSNMNLQQTAMVAQLLEAMASQGGEAQPAWLPIVQQIAQGMVAMAQGAAADRQRALLTAPPHLSPPPRAIGAPQAAPAAPAPAKEVAYRTFEEAPTTQPAAPAPEQRPVPLNESMLNLLPAEYRTPEWRAIIVALHQGAPAANVGLMLAKHLDHLMDFELLPSAFGDFHEDPQGCLLRLVQLMPVYTANHAYCREVIDETLRHLFEMGRFQLSEGEQEATADEEPGDEAPEAAFDEQE